jgi:hypothetical protein
MNACMYMCNARNNLLATPVGPSVTKGMYSLELRCHWYVSTTEVTQISSVGIVEEHEKIFQSLK